MTDIAQVVERLRADFHEACEDMLVVAEHLPEPASSDICDLIQQARTLLDAIEARGKNEPFGYWVEQKGADPVLLRKPAYIPEPSDLRTVTPLYTTAVTAEARIDREVEARELLAAQLPEPAAMHGLPDSGNVTVGEALRAIEAALQARTVDVSHDN